MEKIIFDFVDHVDTHADSLLRSKLVETLAMGREVYRVAQELPKQDLEQVLFSHYSETGCIFVERDATLAFHVYCLLTGKQMFEAHLPPKEFDVELIGWVRFASTLLPDEITETIHALDSMA